MGVEQVPAFEVLENGNNLLRVLPQPSTGSPFTTYEIHWIERAKYRCPGREVCPACAYVKRCWGREGFGDSNTARSLRPIVRNDFQAVQRRFPDRVACFSMGSQVVGRMAEEAINFHSEFRPADVDWVLRPIPNYPDSATFLQAIFTNGDQTDMSAYSDWLRERDMEVHADAYGRGICSAV